MQAVSFYFYGKLFTEATRYFILDLINKKRRKSYGNCFSGHQQRVCLYWTFVRFPLGFSDEFCMVCEYTCAWEFLICDYPAVRFRHLFQLPIGLHSSTMFSKSIGNSDRKADCEYWNHATGRIFSEFSYACRTGKYYRCYRSHCSGGTGSTFLDVGISIFWYGNRLHGRCSGSDF